MDNIFDLRDISYSYVGKIDALKEISLKVGYGEQVSIIGSNGSGKSTLLAILNGLIYPTSGEFYAFNNRITEEVFDTIKDNEFRSFFRTKVGFVFQNSDVQLFSPTVFEKAHPWVRDKWVVRKVADRWVPKDLSQRIKIGFWTTAFQRMQVAPAYFEQSLVRDLFELSPSQMHTILHNADQDLMMRLLHLDVWAHVCLRDLPLDSSVRKLHDHVSIRPE